MFFVLLFSFCFSFVINIDGVVFDRQDFYSKYSKLEWDVATEGRKRSILTDYVKRESAVLDAFRFGFTLDPIVLRRFEDIKNQLLVNFFYDNNVALPLIKKADLVLTKKYLKKEVNVKHLLISHNKSELSGGQDVSRSKKAAVKLINELRPLIDSNVSLFDSLALIYSDDPGVQKNLGALGWLEWGRTPMSFQSSVWGTRRGELSAPIETQYGYHLAYVIDSRFSEFFYYDSSSYNYESLRRLLPLVRDSLRAAAEAYERGVFAGDVVLYEKSFSSVFLLLKERLSSLSPGERFVFVDFLKTLNDRFVLCSIKNNLFGVRAFLSEISKQNPSQVPDFHTKESLVSYFKLLILRDFIEIEAKEEGLDARVFFKKRLSVERGRFLYDFYLKNLVNSVSSPDSSSIKKYYLQNRENKYYVPEKVLVRQIRVKRKLLADSLSQFVSPKNFKEIASSFSINRKNLGGLMDPFERGKYNSLGEEAFSLGVGGISGVIENLDKTFSIIMLEKKIKKEHLPLSRVYKRIESLLLKEGQENIKKNTFDNYLNNKNLLLGDEYKIYFN